MRLPIYALAVTTAFAQWQAPKVPPPYQPTPDERAALISRLTELGKRISLIRAARHDATLLADVEVYHKAGAWLLRYPEEFYNKTYLDQALLVLDRGIARAKELESGKPTWPTRKGRLALGYRSRVDSSLQPYAIVVPESHDPSRPTRLDVVLHGRSTTLSEIGFISAQEQPKPGTPAPQDRIELHVFGRTNNAYRWSGETDVFEAIEDAQARFKIDPARVVLRGFSMGGAGAWHIGLHHPDRWAAIEAGAGFNETKSYARLDQLPAYQEAALKIYDAFEYARNAFQLPIVGYGGELDPQLRASLNIQRQLEKEGLTNLRALFLVGPNTEHRWHPETLKESNAFLDAAAAKGRTVPSEISLVTYTTRYNRSDWITIEALEKHYERAQVDARRSSDATHVTTRNVARLRVVGSGALLLDGQNLRAGALYEKRGGQWIASSKPSRLGKRHGLQGPIDDAFMDSFVCVRPTGTAFHADSAEAAAARFDRFANDYAKWLRADPRTLDDREVNDEHIRSSNLVLFGDPASNGILKKIAPKLPVRWDAKGIEIGGKSFLASSHVLVMIYPNPLNPGRYVVINSGHTFGEKEFRGTNALLFPRLGDWAVLTTSGEVAAAGIFDEDWRP